MKVNKVDLKFLGNCPVCSEPYRQEKISVVDKGKEAINLHIDCAKCGSSMLLAVNSGLKGMVTTIGIPTDVSKVDLPKIRNTSRITADDILELHTYLERKSK